MTDLSSKKCAPCEGDTSALKPEAAKKLLAQLKDWTLNAAATEIQKTFNFKNFYQTMAFVNAVAWIANQENHHPDLEVGYNRCVVHYNTHAVNGLSENDFICAAKIDQLLSS